jgi:hypothetical protein
VATVLAVVTTPEEMPMPMPYDYPDRYMPALSLADPGLKRVWQALDDAGAAQWAQETATRRFLAGLAPLCWQRLGCREWQQAIDTLASAIIADVHNTPEDAPEMTCSRPIPTVRCTLHCRHRPRMTRHRRVDR